MGVWISLAEGILRDMPGAAVIIGFDLISGFENVAGSQFADFIEGSDAANRLLGNYALTASDFIFV